MWNICFLGQNKRENYKKIEKMRVEKYFFVIFNRMIGVSLLYEENGVYQR